ncbi:MAG: beta strand repeat-containing protein, partial [Planctomycetaceae bacterium]
MRRINLRDWFSRKNVQALSRRVSRRSRRQSPQSEQLEDRTLLSVTSMFNSGTGALSVTADAADNVEITAVGGEVKINGADPDTGTVFAEEVVTIDVSATGNFSNIINLVGVDPAVFGGVSGVTLAGGAGNDEITAPRLDSLVRGEDGNDTLRSGDGDDTIEGGDGNDLLLVVDGSDTYRGGIGNDTYEFVSGTPSGLGVNIIDETAGGTDVFDFQQFNGVTFDAGQSSQTFDSGSDITLVGASSIEVLNGSPGDDSLSAGAGVDTTLRGGGGDDTLTGNSGADFLDGGVEQDSLLGAGGNDTYVMRGGQQIVEEAGGSDTLDFSNFPVGVTIDLDHVGQQTLSGTNTLNIAAGVLENFVGTTQADDISALPLAGIANTRSILGGDPITSPGDSLTVDFGGAVAGITVTGLRRGRATRFGDFGDITFSELEHPQPVNQGHLNLILEPDDTNGLTLRRDGDDVIVGGNGDDYIDLGADTLDRITYLGTESVDNHLTVDLTNGAVSPTNGIHMAGGDGGNDLLTIIDGGTHELIYSPDAEVFGNGAIAASPPGGLSLTFEGLEPVEIIGLSSSVLRTELPNADDTITIADGLTFSGDPAMVISGTTDGVGFEQAVLRNVGLVILDTQIVDGDDTVTIEKTDSLHGIEQLQVLTGTSGNDVVRMMDKAITLGVGLEVADTTVEASGTIGGSVQLTRSSLAPGSGPGQLSTGDLATVGSSELQFQIDGTVPGVDYQQLMVTGTVTLSTAVPTVSLNVSGALAAPPTNPLVIVANDGTDAIGGQFSGLPEGALVSVNGIRLALSYVGGDGNDITLAAPPAPNEVYVDDDLSGTTPGTNIPDANPDAPGNQPGTFGLDVFATITEGVAAVASGGTVHIVGGTYIEDITITKSLILDGTSRNRRDVRIGGDGISIEAGGDGVTLRDLRVTTELRADSVVA